jgi:hypothetical protein
MDTSFALDVTVGQAADKVLAGQASKYDFNALGNDFARSLERELQKRKKAAKKNGGDPEPRNERKSRPERKPAKPKIQIGEDVLCRMRDAFHVSFSAFDAQMETGKAELAEKNTRLEAAKVMRSKMAAWLAALEKRYSAYLLLKESTEVAERVELIKATIEPAKRQAIFDALFQGVKAAVDAEMIGYIQDAEVELLDAIGDVLVIYPNAQIGVFLKMELEKAGLQSERALATRLYAATNIPAALQSFADVGITLPLDNQTQEVK